MRFFKVLLALAAVAVALPQEETKNELIALKAKSALADFEAPVEKRDDDVPILDARIARFEKEERTVNLSPVNNRRDGQ